MVWTPCLIHWWISALLPAISEENQGKRGIDVIPHFPYVLPALKPSVKPQVDTLMSRWSSFQRTQHSQKNQSLSEMTKPGGGGGCCYIGL